MSIHTDPMIHETYQIALQWSVVHLGDENLNRKAGCNNRAEKAGRDKSKWNLQRLTQEALLPRKHLFDLAGYFVPNLLLWLKVSILGKQDRDTSDLPSNTKLHLLALPIFDEHNAHKAIDNRIHCRKRTQKKPAGETKDSREQQESKIRLQKGKVKANLFPSVCYLFIGEPVITFSPNLFRI